MVLLQHCQVIHTTAEIYQVKRISSSQSYTHVHDSLAFGAWRVSCNDIYVKHLVVGGSRDGSVGSAFECELMCRFESSRG